MNKEAKHDPVREAASAGPARIANAPSVTARSAATHSSNSTAPPNAATKPYPLWLHITCAQAWTGSDPKITAALGRYTADAEKTEEKTEETEETEH